MNDFQSPNQRYNPQQPQAWPPQQSADGSWGSLQAQTAAQATVAERMGFIRKVYALFFAATLFAIGGVALGLSFEPLLVFAFEHRLIMFLMMIGAVMGATAVRHVPVVNVLALFAFTTFTGLVISPLMYLVGRSNPASIWQAGVLTVGIFGGLTAYVFISKRDFSFLRGMLWTGLIVMILGGLLNVFIVGSSALGFGLAAATLLLFAGFVLYDTSNIMRRYPTNEYIAGALDLYLDAFNIFLALIRILNAGRR
ncbi:MAG: modulator of FtsH protease [Pyrinomonadaceae bacterium]|nr:modulator of FtsH protease [Pyrinomonadaceae bacterium]